MLWFRAIESFPRRALRGVGAERRTKTKMMTKFMEADFGELKSDNNTQQRKIVAQME